MISPKLFPRRDRLVLYIFLMGLFSVALLCRWGLTLAETVIDGGRMELKDRGEKVIFLDGVRITRGPDVLTANTMETNKTRDKVDAFGNVKFKRIVSSTETCFGTSEKARYNAKTGEGSLFFVTKQPRVIYENVISSTMTRTLDIIADQFDFEKSSSIVVGMGHVYGVSTEPGTKERYEFWSSSATYNGLDKRILLTGKNPSRVLQTAPLSTKDVRGDRVTYDMGRRIMTAEGSAVAVFSDIQ